MNSFHRRLKISNVCLRTCAGENVYEGGSGCPGARAARCTCDVGAGDDRLGRGCRGRRSLPSRGARSLFMAQRSRARRCPPPACGAHACMNSCTHARTHARVPAYRLYTERNAYTQTRARANKHKTCTTSASSTCTLTAPSSLPER